MLISRRVASFALAALFATLGCHAQTEVKTGSPLSPALEHRIDVLLRTKAELPPEADIAIGPVEPSDIAGYHTISVSFSVENKTSHPVTFLLSDDGKTIAQFIKYDLTADPRTMVSDAGRPSRGGPASAPVIIVNFDDLECPFCSRFHDSLFPAVLQRYGDKVHIVYRPFPIEQHPWAMHAAIDVNCLAAQSPTGYWNLVDYIHHHREEIGADPSAKPGAPAHTLDRADAQLDKFTREQGALQKVNAATLEACIAKQDPAVVNASIQLGESLNVDSTPTFFINGEKFEGAVPIAFIFARIDDALRAQDITPPPAYVPPAPPAQPAAKAPATPAKTAPSK